ncbi:MAG: class I SAM-dependent methyltransferase, partial [Solirubrobacterales bacterium]|nr:class I SAM-dependent methyltransferase [Solirubrobacterales bacterium]
MADHAVRARSFGAVAEEYDRGRPGYPSEAVAWALGSEPLDVVDLGAGTGKLTATLVQTGHRVVAVEPDPEMRALLERDLPSVRVAAADAEATGLPAASADAVVAGAAFHWFDRSRVFPEIARLLRPPGVLALFGNSFADDSDWAERFRKLGHGAAPGRAGRWPEADELSTYFQAVEDARFAHTHHVTRA